MSMTEPLLRKGNNNTNGTLLKRQTEKILGRNGPVVYMPFYNNMME
jgi:hypothetical protein